MLKAHNVDTAVSPADDGMPSLLGIFVNWFPMLLSDRRVGVLPAPDAVGRRQGDGLRQDRAPSC